MTSFSSPAEPWPPTAFSDITGSTGQPAPGPADAIPEAAATGPGAAVSVIVNPVRDGDEAWAMFGYLGVPFVSILAPLAVFAVRARRSAYLRQHAIQALNLSITVALYNICALILAGILALDAVGVALAIALPAALLLWLVTLAYLVRAALRASHGEFYPLPAWLCATIAR
jgi:uncharacterized Tic20 family protein